MKWSKKEIDTISKSVVRIYAENIEIDWSLPYVTYNSSGRQGSGTIINKEGYILTCFHVIENTKYVYIDIPYISSEKVRCDIISVCPYHDIALIQIQKNTKIKNLNVLPISTTTWNLEVGMEVYAVGYPLNVSIKDYSSGNNVKLTLGIISGQHFGHIQTDTPINSGNSGGPLMYKNKIIGINVMSLRSTADNIGYAVPTHCFLNIYKDMLGSTIIYRPIFNFEYNKMNEEMLITLTNSKIKSGIQIYSLHENSLLKGIEEGDILTHMDKFKINNNGYVNKKWLGSELDLSTIFNLYKNNKTVSIEYYSIKNKEKRKTMITLYPNPSHIRLIYPLYEKFDYIITSGMILVDLSENIINLSFHTNQNLSLVKFYKNSCKCKKNIVIVNIFPNSSTNILNNLNIYNIITRINNIDIETISDAKKALKKPLQINKIKYIKIENDEGAINFFELKKVINEDNELSVVYKYPLVKNQYGSNK